MTTIDHASMWADRDGKLLINRGDWILIGEHFARVTSVSLTASRTKVAVGLAGYNTVNFFDTTECMTVLRTTEL